MNPFAEALLLDRVYAGCCLVCGKHLEEVVYEEVYHPSLGRVKVCKEHIKFEGGDSVV